MRIPLYRPALGEAERRAAARVLDRGVLSRGIEVRAFEEEFAEFVGRRHAVAVNSGTAALHLAVIAIGWGDAVRVLTSALGYIATANALLFTGAVPSFVDVDPETLNLAPGCLDPTESRRARGLLLTHLLGLPVDAEETRRLRDAAGLEVIEDASHAIGSPSARFPVGSYGAATVYSLHESKPLTTGGEGGVITTDDEGFADDCRSLCDQGRQDGADWLARVSLGYSYRLTELQAAVGRAQLRKLPAMLARRAEIAGRYGRLIADMEEVAALPEPPDLDRSWFMYFVRFAARPLRDHAEDTLAAAEIQSCRLLPPIPRFPQYRRIATGTYPHAQAAHDTCLALPLHPGMSDEMVDEVAAALQASLHANPRTPQIARC